MLAQVSQTYFAGFSVSTDGMTRWVPHLQIPTKIFKWFSPSQINADKTIFKLHVQPQQMKY